MALGIVLLAMAASLLSLAFGTGTSPYARNDGLAGLPPCSEDGDLIMHTCNEGVHRPSNCGTASALLEDGGCAAMCSELYKTAFRHAFRCGSNPDAADMETSAHCFDVNTTIRGSTCAELAASGEIRKIYVFCCGRCALARACAQRVSFPRHSSGVREFADGMRCVHAGWGVLLLARALQVRVSTQILVRLCLSCAPRRVTHASPNAMWTRMVMMTTEPLRLFLSLTVRKKLHFHARFNVTTVYTATSRTHARTHQWHMYTYTATSRTRANVHIPSHAHTYILTCVRTAVGWTLRQTAQGPNPLAYVIQYVSFERACLSYVHDSYDLCAFALYFVCTQFQIKPRQARRAGVPRRLPMLQYLRRRQRLAVLW